MHRGSIQRKLRLLLVITSTVALLLASAGFVAADLTTARADAMEELSALAAVIGLNSSAPLLFADPDAAEEVLSALRADPHILGSTLYTKEGKVFASFSRHGYSSPSRPELTDSPAVIEILRVIEIDDENIGSVYIATDSKKTIARMKKFLLLAVLILAVSLGVALMVSSRLQKIISVPILDLAAAAREVTQNENYAARVVPSRKLPNDEIGELVLGFNAMLSEIERRDAELQRHRNNLERQVEDRTADLAAAKSAAERIAERNAQLSRHNQTILDAAGDGIFGLDANGLVTFINPSAARMLGWNGEDLIGQPLHSVIHPENSTVSQSACAVCCARLRPVTRTSRTESFRRRNGTEFAVEYTASTIIDDSGRDSGVVVTFRDVTEQVAVDRMKDEFVSTVSHELRTPLTSIRGALGLLGSGLLGATNERGKRMLDIAITNTDRLVRLINDILDLERIESGRVELNRQPADAAALMIEAAETVQAVADAAGVTLEVVPVHARLLVDRDRVIQTLTNLLGNAIKFSQPGSTVTMSGATQNQFVVSVKDQGRGIPAEKIETIFERFKQVDASDSRVKGGSGLGLAICRSIVNAHGGRIWAESAEGVGSTFTLTLPLAEEKVAQLAEGARASLAAALAGASSVLVVEDDTDLARVIIMSLQSRGITALHAGNGAEAIEACKQHPPALIVLDLVLPEIDGFAVVEWLRENTTLERTPLLIFSAHELAAADQRRLRLGPTEFLTKSRVSLDEVSRRVAALLNTLTESPEAADVA